MNWIDLTLAVLLIVSIVSGLKLGFARTAIGLLVLDTGAGLRSALLPRGRGQPAAAHLARRWSPIWSAS